MRRHLSFVALVLSAVVATLTAAKAEVGAPVEVGLDKARIVVLQQAASDIIIGNPAYADVTLQSPRRLILFGKRVGQTNIIILDSKRREILSTKLVVVPSSDVRIRAPGQRPRFYACGSVRCSIAAGGASGGGGGSDKEIQLGPEDAEAAPQGQGAEEPVGEPTEEVIE